MRRDVLDGYHPLVVFIYFAMVIIASVVLFHPLASAVSLAAALLYGIWLKGMKAVKYFILPLAVAAVTLLVNTLFVHQGITVIAYMGENPITREAVIYGLCAGLMTGSMLMWFYCAGCIMTSDKFIYIFGRIMPAASLMFSMTMRFVPRFAGQAGKISAARRAMGCSDGRKTASGLKTVSVMATWALENSIDTADSMKARGYGRRGRSRYAIFRWEPRDILLLVICTCLTVCALASNIRIVCYPMVRLSGSAAGLPAFAVLCLIPLAMNVWEGMRWKYLQSKI
ncbi:MAG: energy-coupling factor transporter transmembrane component T [Anaerovoracaceae bacterium]|jgi:energy-coupling factor transport system permease protein